MNDSFFCRRDPAARLIVRGEDAATFLQGQFTNDLRRPGPGGCTYGLWLNQKGRVLADSFVLQRGTDELEIVSLHSPAQVIRERLEAYVVADDVEIEDATARSVGWIVSGAGAAAALYHLGLVPPTVGVFSTSPGSVAVFRARATGEANWFLSVPPDHAEAWMLRIEAALRLEGATEVIPEDLNRSRLAAGIPEIPVDLGPGDLPNEGGLEHEALSFTKGCYLGQEVMARLHNMGQVRRRLFVVEGMGGSVTSETGSELFRGDKRVGDVRSIVADGAGSVIALAMLHTTHVSVGDELALAPNGSVMFRIRALAEGRAW